MIRLPRVDVRSRRLRQVSSESWRLPFNALAIKSHRSGEGFVHIQNCDPGHLIRAHTLPRPRDRDLPTMSADIDLDANAMSEWTPLLARALRPSTKSISAANSSRRARGIEPQWRLMSRTAPSRMRSAAA